MNARPTLWLAALTDYVPPLALVSEMGRNAWIRRDRQRHKALQTVANSLCNMVTVDRRYPNEVRLNHPHGGLLVLDVLTRRCTLNDADVNAIGLVDRLRLWLHAQLDNARIPQDRICCVRLEMDYTAGERTYLASGRVWEMQFSLRSEVATLDQSYVGTAPACTAAVPYGIGALIAW